MSRLLSSQDIQIQLINSDTVAIVPIERIRIANKKILEGQHYRSVTNDLSAIIRAKNAIIGEKEKLYQIKLEESKVCRGNINNLSNRLINSEKKAYKFKKQRNILGVASIALFALLLF